MKPNVPDFSTLKWKCHCCDRDREDKFIKISTHDTSKLFSNDTGSMYINARYCNDNEECKKKAFNREWVINRFFNDFMQNNNKLGIKTDETT